MFNFLKSKKPYNDVTAVTFNQLIQEHPDTIILDVRTPAEVRERAIPKSININSQQADFEQKIAKLDKSKTYLVYCRSGMRSGQACRTMAANGFDTIYNLSGGLMSYPF